jgi:hypothetical protein
MNPTSPTSTTAVDISYLSDDHRNHLTSNLSTLFVPVVKTRAHIFNNLPFDVIGNFFDLLLARRATDIAGFLRFIMQINRAHQQLGQNFFNESPALCLASTRHSIPEIVRRTSHKNKIKKLVGDLVERHSDVYVDISGRKTMPNKRTIIKTLLQTKKETRLTLDLSAGESVIEKKGCARQIELDLNRVGAFYKGAHSALFNQSKLNIELILKDRYFTRGALNRLGHEKMPPISKLDLAGVRLFSFFEYELPSATHLDVMVELLKDLFNLFQRGELKHLSLANTLLSPALAKLLVQLIRQSNVRFEVLNLSGNAIGSAASSDAALSLDCIHTLNKLLASACCPDFLDLSNNGMSDADADLLLAELKPELPLCHQIQLSGNPINEFHPIWAHKRVVPN